MKVGEIHCSNFFFNYNPLNPFPLQFPVIGLTVLLPEVAVNGGVVSGALSDYLDTKFQIQFVSSLTSTKTQKRL